MYNLLVTMKPLYLTFLLLTCICNHVLAEGTFETEAILAELQELNFSCSYDYVKKLCDNYRPYWEESICNCEILCAQLGTCCITSSYRYVPEPKLKPTCRDKGFLMIDQCPESSRSSSPYADLCNEDRNDENDLMRLVPVTSLFTHITYKNFFCFLCHESNDDYLFWNVQISSDDPVPDVNLDDGNVPLTYDEYNGIWVVHVGEGGGISVPVNLEFAAPGSITDLAKSCSPSLISDCAVNWPDDDVRAKCGAYMLSAHISRNGTTLKFKNPHCALCNFEDVADAYCPRVIGYAAKVPFSFTFLLDVNRSDGDRVGQIGRCSGNDVWDPFFKKCRTLLCAIPTYIMQEGKCVPP